MIDVSQSSCNDVLQLTAEELIITVWALDLSITNLFRWQTNNPRGSPMAHVSLLASTCAVF